MCDLLDALLLQKTDLLLKLLASGTDCNQTNSNGSTPLHLAAFFANNEAVDALIGAGARVNAKDNQGVTALHRAVMKNNVAIVDKLIAARCDTSVCCEQGQTPLHTAAIHSSYKSAKRLLSTYRNNEIDQPDVNGCTALHCAAYHGNSKMVQLLLKRGASVGLVDRLGRSPVHWTAAGGGSTVLSHLVDAGAFCGSRDKKGRTALHYAAQGSRVDVVLDLSSSASLLDLTDDDGFTAFHYAVQSGTTKVAKVLLNARCNPNIRSKDGTTPLHLAAFSSDNCDMIEFLISVLPGAALTETNDAGLSALHLASEHNRLSRVDALIAACVNVECVSRSKATPLHCATLAGNQLIMKHLISANANCESRMSGGFTPLHLAAYRGCLHVVETLLERDVDVNATDNHGRTPIMLAAISNARYGEVVVSRLIDAKSDLSAMDDLGWTALHHAAAEAVAPIVELLVHKGSDVDRPDHFGRNALHYAAQRSLSLDCIQVICRSKMSCVERKDKNGYYPLHYAALTGRADLCIMLLDVMQCGAEMPSSGSPLHLTPLHLAAMARQDTVIAAITRAFKKSMENMDQTYRKSSTIFRPILTCTDARRRIPLHYAMKEGDLPCVKELLAGSGVEMYTNWDDKNEVTPLHLAAANGHMTCIDYILDHHEPMTVNRVDSRKRSFGMLAVTSQCSTISGKLMGLVNVNLVDSSGRGFLHRAVFARRRDMLPLLLRRCNVNLQDMNGVTALHVAASMGDRDMVCQLLAAGALPTGRTSCGLTPADCAASQGHLSVLEVLLVDDSPSRLSDDSALGTGDESPAANGGVAAHNTTAGTIDQCNRKEVVTSASILLSARGGHLPCVIHLFECRSDLLCVVDHGGRTPLHLAALNGHYETVEYLVDRGAELDGRDREQKTPLLLAVTHPHAVNTADLLLHKGSDASLVDSDGNTALHLCCINRNEDAGKVVIEHLVSVDSEDRAVLNATNARNETALHIATRNGLPDLLYKLIPYSTESWWKEDYLGRIPLCSAIEDSEVHECMVLLLKFAFEKGLLIEDESINSLHSSMRERSSTGVRRSSLDSSDCY